MRLGQPVRAGGVEGRKILRLARFKEYGPKMPAPRSLGLSHKKATKRLVAFGPGSPGAESSACFTSWLAWRRLRIS